MDLDLTMCERAILNHIANKIVQKPKSDKYREMDVKSYNQCLRLIRDKNARIRVRELNHGDVEITVIHSWIGNYGTFFFHAPL